MFESPFHIHDPLLPGLIVSAIGLAMFGLFWLFRKHAGFHDMLVWPIRTLYRYRFRDQQLAERMSELAVKVALILCGSIFLLMGTYSLLLASGIIRNKEVPPLNREEFDRLIEGMDRKRDITDGPTGAEIHDALEKWKKEGDISKTIRSLREKNKKRE